MVIPKAIFLDRDGTLILEKNYLSDPKGVELVPTAIEALKLAKKHSILLILVTNQSGIGRGYFSEKNYMAVHQELEKQLKEHNLILDASYYCPHHPTEAKKDYLKDCTMRKPRPGMLLKGIKTYNLPPNNCAMIGDKESDIKAGNAAGMTTVLIQNDNQHKKSSADFQTNTLLESIKVLLKS